MADSSHYDVIIIGSGAGGGTLACKLASSGKKILILERGAYVPREKDNWDPRAVNLEGKYQTKEKWRDKDGNELAGVRMPPVEAPIATTTGWALRRAGFSENEGCESNGQHIPFTRTKAERIATGDPRLSLEERYKDHAGYVKAVRKAAEKLEKQGFLLPVDVQRYVDEAAASSVLK